MLKRVVITGMGVVSPNGIGKTAFCRAILDGKSGVKTISRFDTSDLPVKIAGEISDQDFNELDWIEARERKHVSRCVPLAVAASRAWARAAAAVAAANAPIATSASIDSAMPGIEGSGDAMALAVAAAAGAGVDTSSAAGASTRATGLPLPGRARNAGSDRVSP